MEVDVGSGGRNAGAGTRADYEGVFSLAHTWPVEWREDALPVEWREDALRRASEDSARVMVENEKDGCLLLLVPGVSSLRAGRAVMRAAGRRFRCDLCDTCHTKEVSERDQTMCELTLTDEKSGGTAKLPGPCWPPSRGEITAREMGEAPPSRPAGAGSNHR